MIKPAAERGAWNNFVQAALMSWEHIEKCRPYTPGEGYGWRTGQPDCPDPVTHQRRLTEEGEAWHAWRELVHRLYEDEDRIVIPTDMTPPSEEVLAEWRRRGIVVDKTEKEESADV